MKIAFYNNRISEQKDPWSSPSPGVNTLMYKPCIYVQVYIFCEKSIVPSIILEGAYMHNLAINTGILGIL